VIDYRVGSSLVKRSIDQRLIR